MVEMMQRQSRMQACPTAQLRKGLDSGEILIAEALVGVLGVVEMVMFLL